MSSPGLTGSPVTRNLLIYLVLASLLLSNIGIPDVSNPSLVSLAARQAAYYGRPISVLFASVVVYQLRVLERLWGSRKYGVRCPASIRACVAKVWQKFVLTVALPATVLPPLALTSLHAVIPGLSAVALPEGPTVVLWALMSQYCYSVPCEWTYASTGPVRVTSKALAYLLPLQVAFSQVPGSMIGAVCGWAFGYGWRSLQR